MVDIEYHMEHNCVQCSGSGKIFFRIGASIPYIDCDMCNGTGISERNVLWAAQGMILKGFRIIKEITLREAARRFKIDPSNLSKMERGIIKPNPKYLKMILESDKTTASVK